MAFVIFLRIRKNNDNLSSPINIQVPELDEVTLDNLFSVVIEDKGDFYGNNIN